MLKNKKAEFPLINTIVIILISSFILISFIIVIFQSKSMYIDEKKINTQLVINKFFSDGCFDNNEFGIFDFNLLTEENLNLCLKGIDNEILLRVTIENESGILKELYLNENKEKFSNLANYCSLNSNLLCSEIKYPSYFKNILSDNNNQLKILKLQIISQ